MYATFGSSETGDVGPTIGPIPFAQLTFGMLRAGESQGDAYTVAVFDSIGPSAGLWRIVTPEGIVPVYEDDERIDANPARWNSIVGSLWTDITLHVDPKDALA